MDDKNPAEGQRHLAVLIDADNAPPAIVEGLFEEIAKYGVASVKRIYGDWTKPNLGGWKKVLLDYSIQPVQQFAYTQGKNATDSSLIIDAMDLLYSRELGGFCLVSSDSDFTRLAARLREAGVTVYGFGEKKTPNPFVAACDKFIYTEILRADAEEPAPAKSGGADGGKAADKPAQAQAAKAQSDKEKPPLNFIARVIEDISDDEDWVHLGALGQNLNKRSPAFDTRLYGFKKLSELLKAHPNRFEVQEAGGSGGSKALRVRNKRKR
ncbi:NYN domain-containing protein [Alloalcanivorax venustensis]|uniref:NYN domain-containing protein n=1 Tax=Alloalcanivorax venustensis TaxID=172371 RepID=UPI003C691053